MIRAIETSYAGCRFRSRLEARWAVFLDHLKITWEYERQGFDLPSGRYLPDFWLPEPGTWIEVKGAEATDLEYAKLTDLARAVCAAGHRVQMLTGGIPRRAIVVHGKTLIAAETPIPFWALDAPAQAYDVPPQRFADASLDRWTILDGTWQPGPCEQLVNAALTAARSARFEHGQHGA